MFETTSTEAAELFPSCRYFSQTFSNRIIQTVLPLNRRGPQGLPRRKLRVLRAAGNNAIASVIMRLSCPNCQTEYDVPDAALTGRARMLRCANCMTKWQAPALEMYREEPVAEPLAEPVAPEPAAAQQDVGDTAVIGEAPPATTADAAMAEEEAVQPPEPEPEPERISLFKPSRELPPAMAPRPASGRGLKISILLVVVVIAVVLLAHRPIGHVWPPSLRLFNALGL